MIVLEHSLSDIFWQAYTTILPIVTPILLGYIIKKMEYSDKKRDANGQGMQILLLDLLERMHADYISKGHITREEYTKFENVYYSYHNLGGNGWGTSMWKEVQALKKD